MEAGGRQSSGLVFRNGARSPIVLGLAPLTSLNRSFLWMTELSNSQNVAVPLSTRTNRRLKRSPSAVVRPRGNMPQTSTPLWPAPHRKMLATSSRRNDEFYEAYSGSEIKVSRFSFGEVLASPNVETFLFRRLSVQLSLGGLLSSRAHLCLTGQPQLKRLPPRRSIAARRPIESEVPRKLKSPVVPYKFKSAMK